MASGDRIIYIAKHESGEMTCCEVTKQRPDYRRRAAELWCRQYALKPPRGLGRILRLRKAVFTQTEYLALLISINRSPTVPNPIMAEKFNAKKGRGKNTYHQAELSLPTLWLRSLS